MNQKIVRVKVPAYQTDIRLPLVARKLRKQHNRTSLASTVLYVLPIHTLTFHRHVVKDNVRSCTYRPCRCIIEIDAL